MKRAEEIMAKALKVVDGDRYKLSLMVAKRANQIHAGAEVLLSGVDTRNMKFADIALLEIAEGKIVLDGIIEADK
ncbi:DNA-directed RNA polymerase subunit omega [Campylobacter geochelonis]|uniref:DNA-directed RNA polymerase subunit omega n=1 Tax=Campylobacter geochelonis TaxID=1780362 RepID=A0A128ERM6_9BACT|nr:DNA-directed RNA polymerase subunit omega [Campylobacter geochelonis]QKF71696.1 DNA-directed RNA polymerase, omega subunit [Campylobacter geochelonis]CZE49203.1 DNA-directed RNA polymerase%2C omega subunit [Campylobacter geochelonis]CZE49225.1 DNA-directed RNA polymerase%2C omega subunit [Campylobacter geochelonis]CZE51313.1 DNA-directed RNA polymerase%2C omega subunit [Campylobacter geochelonis]